MRYIPDLLLFELPRLAVLARVPLPAVIGRSSSQAPRAEESVTLLARGLDALIGLFALRSFCYDFKQSHPTKKKEKNELGEKEFLRFYDTSFLRRECPAAPPHTRLDYAWDERVGGRVGGLLDKGFLTYWVKSPGIPVFPPPVVATRGG